MQEIKAKQVYFFIKQSDDHPDKWCLVHDKTKVIVLIPPGGKTWVNKNPVMLVGTEQELRDEIKRLNLKEYYGSLEEKT